MTLDDKNADLSHLYPFSCCSNYHLQCQIATRVERFKSNMMKKNRWCKTTMTKDKAEVSKAFRAALKRKQQTTINSATYLPSGPSKSTIVNMVLMLRKLLEMDKWVLQKVSAAKNGNICSIEHGTTSISVIMSLGHSPVTFLKEYVTLWHDHGKFSPKHVRCDIAMSVLT
jgi:hypothetical protein